jgi:hypothetical protein
MFEAIGEVKHALETTTGRGVLLLLGGLVLNYLTERHVVFGRLDDLLFPLASFFLCLTGVVLAIGGMIRRSRRFLIPAFLILIPFTVGYVGLFLGMMFIQTGADRLGECPGLDQAAASSNVIPESLSTPGNRAVSCGVERRGMFLAYFNKLIVYGVTDASAQQRVLDRLRESHRSANTHPLRVMFYEKENWTVRIKKNGIGPGKRGPEKLIRVVNIG